MQVDRGGCAEEVAGGTRAPAQARGAECQRDCGMPVAGAALHDKQPREKKHFTSAQGGNAHSARVGRGRGLEVAAADCVTNDRKQVRKPPVVGNR